MHNSLLTEDTYKRADLIYKSIAEEYNPCLRDFVNCSKAHEKSFVETGRTYKSCHDAAVKIGISAASSPGCKDVGKSIMDIAETLQEVNMIREDWLNKFRDDVIYPIERRLDQDSKYVVGLRKKAQEEFKSRNSESEKAMQNLTKLKKKSSTKAKTEQKIQKATEKLLSAKAATEMMAHEMLNRAFCEERRRYCFFVEKQCDLIKAWMEYHRETFDVLQANLQQWQTVAASYRDLLPGAVALIDSSLPRQTNVTMDDMDVTAGGRGERVPSDDFSTMFQGPAVNTQVSNKVNLNLRRNASARVVGSPREVGKENAYPRAKLDRICAEEEVVEEEINEPQEPEQVHEALTFSAESNPRVSPTSSSSSMQSKSLSRNSGTSSVSAYSQESIPSVGPPQIITTSAVRTSLNDSGISVGDVWASESDEFDTIKRAVKNRSPKEEIIEIEEVNREETVQESENIEERSHESEVIEENANEDEENNTPPKIEIFYEAMHGFTPPPGSSAKLSLQRGDAIGVLLNKEQGGWMYGENKRTMEKGWFPVSYTSYGRTPPSQTNRAEPVTEQRSSPIALSPPTPTLHSSLDNVTVQSSPPRYSPVVPTSPASSLHEEQSPQQQVKPKKQIVGRDVFQFARGMNNPFEEIKLRKTTPSLN